MQDGDDFHIRVHQPEVDPAVSITMVLLLMTVELVIGTYGTEVLCRPRARRVPYRISALQAPAKVNSLLQMRKLTLRKSSIVTEL